MKLQALGALVASTSLTACTPPNTASVHPTHSGTRATETGSVAKGSRWSDAVQTEAARLQEEYPTARVAILAREAHTGCVLAKSGDTDGTYPTASTIKGLTIAAALAHGLDEDREFDTATPTFIGTSRVRDHRQHGRLSLADAVAVSSNIALLQALNESDLAQTYATVERLLGDTFPPARTPDEQRWHLFGGTSTATLHALARGYATLFNDGHTPGSAEQVVSSDVAARGRALLYHAVESDRGTGKGARVDGLRVAGKTGTADREAGNAVLFVGATQNAGQDAVVALVVDGVPATAFAGDVAAPAVGNILRHVVRGAPQHTQREN